MESIYDPDKFKASDHVALKDYFKKYSSELFDCQKLPETPDIDEAIFNFMDDKTLDETRKGVLIKSCSTDLLTVPGEKQPLDIKVIKASTEIAFRKFYSEYKITEEALKLQTVRAVNARQGKRVHRLHKLFQESGIAMHTTPISTAEPNLIPGNDFIIYIRLFRPFPYIHGQCTGRNVLKFDHEIAVLGSNTIADFRDKIQCTSDLAVSNESSKFPDRCIKHKSAKELYPSAFIYIDNVFYNDFRNPKAIDYSKVIIKWAKDKEIGEFTTSDICVRFDSLRPRMNYPYVYQHQGNCEHLFMFSMARLTNNCDVLDNEAYPFYSNIGFNKTTFCNMCKLAAATWFVTESDRLPIDTLLCNDCFSSYNYIDGVKIGNFKAYPYMNRSALF